MKQPYGASAETCRVVIDTRKNKTVMTGGISETLNGSWGHLFTILCYVGSVMNQYFLSMNVTEGVSLLFSSLKIFLIL